MNPGTPRLLMRVNLFVAAGRHKRTVCNVRHKRPCIYPDVRSRLHIASCYTIYILYNSRKQQALVWYIKLQHTDPVIHYRLHTCDLSLYQRALFSHTQSHLLDRQQSHHGRRHSAMKMSVRTEFQSPRVLLRNQTASQ